MTMIPAQAVKYQFDYLARVFRSYAHAIDSDRRLASTQRRLDEGHRNYIKALAVWAPHFGITPEFWEYSKDLKNAKEIEAALDMAFPGWKDEIWASLPPRKKAHYTKRAASWRRSR